MDQYDKMISNGQTSKSCSKLPRLFLTKVAKQLHVHPKAAAQLLGMPWLSWAQEIHANLKWFAGYLDILSAKIQRGNEIKSNHVSRTHTNSFHTFC